MADKTTAGLQREMVNNVEDLQFFLRDLNQWETQIKKKDEELRRQASSQTQKLRPIRNLSEKSSSNQDESVNQTEESKGKTGAARIASSDYKAWDKFDVEAACNEVDKEVSSSDDDEDSEVELNRRRQQAILEKDKGNEYLKVGKFNKALECYTKGCGLDPENALLPANRALAYIKNKQFGAAEKDCDTALKLDPTYVKAYQRRAAAREALGKYTLAAEDFESVIRYEPHNKDAVNNLQKLKKLIEKNTANLGKVSCSAELDPEGEIVLPVEKPQHLRSTKPLRRIKVSEINDNKPETQIPKVPKTESKPTLSTDVERKGPTNLPKPPTSFFRLQSDFGQLKTHPELQYQYFKSIPCAQYAALFRENLEPDILSDIIKLFGQFYIKNNDDLYEPLKQLSLAKRFSTLKLFLSQEDKDTLSRIFDHLRSQENYADYEVGDLVDAYS